MLTVTTLLAFKLIFKNNNNKKTDTKNTTLIANRAS